MEEKGGMTVKFLHCADLHLGCPKGKERMTAFRRMMKFCDTQNISLLLIAGDLFDAPDVDEGTVSQVFSAFSENAGMCVLIAAGNHDPLTHGGVYDRALPDNVYVFPEKWSCVEITELNVRVWGQSFTSATAAPFSLPAKKPKPKEGFIDLGLLHGEVGTKSDYRAIPKEVILESSLTYLALGHIHERSDILRAGGTLYAQAGCLQGTGFDEIGEKGAYLGEIDARGNLSMSFVQLCGSQTIERRLNITGCRTLTDIYQKYETQIGDVRPHRLRLTLTGETTIDNLNTLSMLLGKYAGDFMLCDETRVPAALSAGEDTLKGAFIRQMEDMILQKEKQGLSAKLEREALRFGLAAFTGEVDLDADS